MKQGVILLFFVLSFGACSFFEREPEIPSTYVIFPQRCISNVKPWEILSLLKEKKFSELNVIMKKAQDDFEKDFRDEFKMYDIFNTFAIKDQAFEEIFNDWVNQNPGSWQAYLARGTYYSAMGWKSRGYRYATETSEEQFQMMEYYFSLSERDNRKALRLNRKLMYCLGVQININKNFSRNSKQLVEKALKICPESFLIREIYMWSIFPRWGGSYREMKKFAEDAEEFSNSNPLLNILMGYIYYDKGRLAEESKDYKKALSLYSKALKFGECKAFLDERAELYLYYLKDFEKALTDVNRSIRIRPPYWESYALRGKAMIKLGKLYESLDDLRLVEKLCIDKETIKEVREDFSSYFVYEGYLLSKNKEFDEAIQLFDKAEEIYPDNPELFYWRGAAYTLKGDEERALSEMKHAIYIDKKYFDAYKYIDWLLARQGRWDEIISYWDIYLTIKPDDANAYSERSGTYYHKGDFAASYRDAKKACELGNKEACAWADRLSQYAGN